MKKVADSAVTLPAVLLALNIWVCWRLFWVEYTIHFNSVEGYFIAMARYISRHWGEYSWWPLWHAGMPYQDTYVPLLHLVVAGVATTAKISPAHAYHFITAIAYSLGPAMLYLMAMRLGASRGAAFLSALAYSLFSPSAWLLPEIARDVGGLLNSRRLQVLTVYGEGPHIAALTLLPLAILALEAALEKKSGRSFVFASLAIALVFVTNVPGTMALGLAVFCWLAAQPAGRRIAAWKIAAGATVLAYGMVCYAIPPSSMGTVLGNVGSMHPGFAATLSRVPFLLAILAAGVGGIGIWLSRAWPGGSRLPLFARFGILYLGLLGVLVLSARPERFELLPQAGRLQLELEMAACMLLGGVAWQAWQKSPRRVRLVLTVVCIVAVGIQMKHYHARARVDIQAADLSTRSEYVTARWLDANLPGQRVYVTGSTAFWLNAFSDTPQLMGCCNQGQSLAELTPLWYMVNAGVSEDETRLAIRHLQAFGVQAMVVSGGESTDAFRDIQAPERFEGLLQPLHREVGDTIYRIPQRSISLAHILQRGETVPRRESGVVDPHDVVRFADAIEDDARPEADFTWVRGDTARISARLSSNELLSVQVAWMPGWKAFARGDPRPVSADGLGLTVIEPACEGDCEISLEWTGRPDLRFARAVSFASLLVAGILSSRHKIGVI